MSWYTGQECNSNTVHARHAWVLTRRVGQHPTHLMHGHFCSGLSAQQGCNKVAAVNHKLAQIALP